MAYIKPAQNAVDFNWTNDNYSQNSFYNYEVIQMDDKVTMAGFVELIKATDSPLVFRNKYISVLSDTVTINESQIRTEFVLKFLETLKINENSLINARFNTLLTESIGVSSNLSMRSTITLVLADSVATSDNLTPTARLNVNLKEIVKSTVYVEDFTTTVGGIDIPVPRDTYAMNFKNLAFSRYSEDFNFISSVKFNGKYLISNNKGIFENTGDLDVNNTIKSGFRTGLIRFGGQVQSRIDSVFLSIKNSGAVKIKVIGSDGKENIYSLTSVSEELQDRRVKMGKGNGKGGNRRCTYYQFEIISEENFELDTLSVFKLDLSHKI